MKKLALLLFGIWVLCLTGFSQCTVNASANPQLICPGEMVLLSAASNCYYTYECDFFNHFLCSGFTSSIGIDYSNPCGPSHDTTSVYAWMGNTVPIPREITTNNFDIVSGCSVSFYLRFAVNSGLTTDPCEGPDSHEEGVSFQYSINNGSTWSDIAYFRPDGVICASYPDTIGFIIVGNGQTTQFTTWAQYSFPIPSLAISPNTKFRWRQHIYSSMNYDSWGIGNIQINCDDYDVQWSHGPTVINPPPVFPNTDTCYIIHLIDNVMGSVVSDTVCVQILNSSVSTLWNGFIANTTGPNITYQWVDCDCGFNHLSSETHQIFTPTINGNFAVIVSTPNCSDTSDCYTFHHADIVNMVNKNDMLNIFPNPAVDYCLVESPLMISLMEITDVQGKLIKSVQPSSMTAEINVSEFAKGTYYIRITTEKGIFVKPLQVK